MACAGPDRDLPGVVAMVVDKKGDQVFAHATVQSFAMCVSFSQTVAWLRSRGISR